MDGMHTRFCTAPCRGRQLADPLLPGQRGALVVNCLWFLPLGFPRGEAARLDGTSEPARLADEGWRWLKVSDFSVEWCNLKHMPLIQLHSLTNLPPPLISHDKISVPRCRYFIVTASPRGKPRTQKRLAIVIQRTALLRELRVAKLATPTVGCAKLEAYTIQRTAPPQSATLTAPPKVEPGRLRRWRAATSRPYWCAGNRGCNEGAPLMRSAPSLQLHHHAARIFILTGENA